MEGLDPTGDWMRQGARALDSPNSATGESSLERLYSLSDDLDQKGRASRAFLELSEKRKRDDSSLSGERRDRARGYSILGNKELGFLEQCDISHRRTAENFN
ncbi:hypothetical protein R6Q59_000566 [Mikania micrantha]